MDFEAYQEKLNKANNAVFHSHRIFCERVLEFKPGERGIITNGKVNHVWISQHFHQNWQRRYFFFKQNGEDIELFYWIGKLNYMWLILWKLTFTGDWTTESRWVVHSRGFQSVRKIYNENFSWKNQIESEDNETRGQTVCIFRCVQLFISTYFATDKKNVF